MIYTGKLDFVDIGPGTWFLITDKTKYRIQIANQYLDVTKTFKAALLADATVSIRGIETDGVSAAVSNANVLIVQDITSILYM